MHHHTLERSANLIMKILAVGAHPDDLEILCAGTLAKFVKEGHEVTMCHALNGDKGHFHIPPDELGPTRIEEARRGAEAIGAKALYIGYSDCEIHYTPETLSRFVDIVRMERPDLIITHSPDDYMPDHVITSRLITDASFHATVPYFRTEVKEAHNILPPIYYMDNLAGVNFLPTEYVDITDTIELKKEAMRRHESQITWLLEHDHVDILDFIETVAKFRGLQCGVKYAEGFRKYEAWGRNTTRRLLP